jgi:hypothetical protein
MRTCNAEASAKQIAATARKAFMSQCLSGRVAAEPALNSQQQKMRDCNAKAGEQNLTGAARKSFMNSCLKG